MVSQIQSKRNPKMTLRNTRGVSDSEAVLMFAAGNVEKIAPLLLPQMALDGLRFRFRCKKVFSGGLEVNKEHLHSGSRAVGWG